LYVKPGYNSVIMFEIILYSIVTIVILIAYWWNENKWRMFTPTNNKKWRKNQQILQNATFNNDGTITIHNLRDTIYKNFRDYTPQYSDVIVNPNKIVSARLYTAKLSFPGVHMFTSFTFKDGKTISVSVQMRRYKDSYGLIHTFRLFFNPSELMYIILTEKDALTINKKILNRKMHTYDIGLKPKELSKLFISILRRTNKLYEHPEFYSLFSNNCITNVLNHVNKNTHIKLPNMHYSYFATQHLGRLLKRVGLVKK